MTQVDPVVGSETVLLGCLVLDHLRIWRPDGRPACLRVSQPAALAAALGHGLADRTNVEPGRAREIGRLDESGVLCVAGRVFATALSDEPSVTEALWAAAIELFQDAATDAMTRGEYLMVEPGGWSARPDEFAVAGARRTDGEWLLHVEAVPAPHAPSWPEPPEGQPGWGVEAPADDEALESIGALLGDAASMWAVSPFDVVFTFGRQGDGPWPPEDTPAAIEHLLDEIRADIEELHSTRQLERALDLSERTGVHFNHNTYPVFFTGDLRSPLVLVHDNPEQPENLDASYEGDFEYADFDDYLEQHRRYGHYHWEVGDELPAPVDYKQMRFVRQWGVVELLDGDSRDDERANVARCVDGTLNFELIPYGSPRFPAERIPREVVATQYERLMRVVTAFPREYVVLCGAAFETIFEPYAVDRDDRTFRLPTSSGTSRVEYRFSNLLFRFDGKVVAAGFAPNFGSPGVPMEAYGKTCHDLYRDLGR